MKNVICRWLLFVAAASAMFNSAQADTPQLINYQGYLTDDTDTPLGSVASLTFTIYDAPVEGTALWTETHSAIELSGGLFAVLLGSVEFIPGDLFNGTNRWLGIKVESDQEIAPRTQLVSVVYALRVGSIDGASGGVISDSLTVDGTVHIASGGLKFSDGTTQFTQAGASNGLPVAGGTMTGPVVSVGDPPITMGKGNFGTGNSNAGANSFVAGESNDASGDYTGVGSGFGNIATGENTDTSDVEGGPGPKAGISAEPESGALIDLPGYAFVGGGYQNGAIGYASVVGGGYRNFAQGYASVILGGMWDTTIGTQSVISGGVFNITYGVRSVIGGGFRNSTYKNYTVVGGGIYNTASLEFASVVGGYYNEASGMSSAVGGGSRDTASGKNATIGGGDRNTASGDFAVVGGGRRNVASGMWSVVGGGGGSSEDDINIASGDLSVIGGGRRNSASSTSTTVAGGSLNTASQIVATVGGGTRNTADAFGATVPGGTDNLAQGDYSFAAGRMAQTTVNGGGSFVWADQTGVPFTSNLPDQFLVRASGGVGIGTETPSEALDVEGNIHASGTITSGNSISVNGVSNTITSTSGAIGFDDEDLTTTGSIAMGGFSMPTGAADSYVLTSDAGGVGSWQPTPSGGNWTLTGNALFTSDSWGIARAGNILLGLHDSTHVNLGVACTTGVSGYDSFYASVGGGRSNTAAGNGSTASGGYYNTASGHYSTVGGGYGNESSAEASTVAGGYLNIASADNASIGGGYSNVASWQRATVGGGDSDTASGLCSTVPGGWNNRADGVCSFAAGRRAKAMGEGTFVWADNNDLDFSSSVTNEFAARATGGVRFVTGIDGGGTPTAGVQVAGGGGSWSSLSDRNLKDNFLPIDSEKLLDKLAALPVSSWNYKAQDDSIRHIGPMAQDFYAAFDVGEDERHIATIDADGVALAAIQALYEQNKKLQATIEKLEARVSDLEGE